MSSIPVPTANANAEHYLRLAMHSKDRSARVAAIKRGLALPDSEDETRVLLLRQLYKDHVENRRLRQAALIAEEAAAYGELADVLWSDASRAWHALGELEAAIVTQTNAARQSPADRRSFHLWQLATLQHFAGRHSDAIATFDRALRYAIRDRSLVRAHRAWVRLDAGLRVPRLQEIIFELRSSPNARGYGQFILGMLALQQGQQDEAATQLKAFIARHQEADTAGQLSLREEMRRARIALHGM